MSRRGVEHEQVETFLFEEARLIDERRFDEWLELYTDDARYWVPSNRRDIDPMREVSLIYDDKTHMTERVFRITSGASWAQSPPSTTFHLVSNVIVRDDTPEGLQVLSNQIVVELRRGAEQFLAATCEHRLVPTEGSFKIALKRLDLLRADEPIASLTFIL